MKQEKVAKNDIAGGLFMIIIFIYLFTVALIDNKVNSYEKVRSKKTNYRIVKINNKKQVQVRDFYTISPWITRKWKQEYMSIYSPFVQVPQKEWDTLSLEQKIDLKVKYFKQKLTKKEKEVVEVIKQWN